MQGLWVLLYGWVTGIAIVIVLILYGFDVLLSIMRFGARLLGAFTTSGSHSYNVFYANSFFRNLQEVGGIAATADATRCTSSSDDDEEDPSTKADGERKPKSHKHKKRLYGKVDYDASKTLREQGLEGMTGHTATVQPMKLSTTCSMSWFNEADNDFGPPVECRLLLTGRTITIYELLLSGAPGASGAAGGGGGGSARGEKKHRDDPDAGVSRAEHMKGKIHIRHVSSREIKKFNKEAKEASAATPFTGRVLVLSSTDGEPLFAHREEAETSPPAAGSATSGGGGGAEAGTVQPSGSVPLMESSVASLPDDEATSRARTKSRNPRARGGPMSTWCCAIIKFRYSRDTERWQTLLTGIAEADAWRQFAKSMPNPDTLNTFLSRFFFQNMRDGNGIDDALKKLIRKQLVKVSAKKFPRDLQGELKLDDFIIGTSIPWVSDVSEPAVSTNGEVGFDFNLLYKGLDGGLELFFRLALQYRGIRVPHVWFSAKLLELEATVHISIGPPPSKKFWIGGHKPPVLRAEVHQGCASGSGVLHRILTSLPDLSGIFTNLVKLYLFSDMILPVMDDFPLPNLSKTPTSSPREAKQRTFDRKRAAQHSAAPALTGAFTREQLREVERLLETSRADDTTDPYWHPLADDDRDNDDDDLDDADAPPVPSQKSHASPTDEGQANGGTALHQSRRTRPPEVQTLAESRSKTVSFPSEEPPRVRVHGTQKGVGSPLELSASAVSAGHSAPPGSAARASTYSSREVLMASAAALSPDSTLVASPQSLRLDTSLSPPAGLETEDSTALSVSQRANKASASRSVRSLLKVKGDEMSKASVVRRKMKKEKE